MPGYPWTEAERRTLKALRDANVPVADIVSNPELLPGRTMNSIRQVLRRKGWADPERSKACRAAEKLEGEAHQIFIAFLRRHAEAPLEQIALSWNNWASARSWPRVNIGRIGYWLTKLNLEHNRPQAWQSEYGSMKLDKRREERFIERSAEHLRKVELELELRKKHARALKRREKGIEIVTCGHCDNSWPLHEEFFSRLPATFAFNGARLTDFQTEYCKFCRVTNKWLLLLYRAYRKDVSHLIEVRREQERKGLDKAWMRLLEEEKVKRDQLLRRRRTCRVRTCIRCEEQWPLTPRYFRLNRGLADGTPTYRSLCAFCDDWYCRAIDRVVRDGRNPAAIKKERHHYLALARKLNAQTM